MHAYNMHVCKQPSEELVETKASPRAIWQIWEDVKNWNSWDHGIEYSTIDGPFEAGTRGTLKPKGGPLVRTQLTSVEPMRSFVDESSLPLCRMVFSHFLTQSQGKTQVTHEIEMKGPFAFLFAFLIGRKMKQNLPQEMASMIKKAESVS
jgi:Polyketide cyclase / dehydrase and lipid transport